MNQQQNNQTNKTGSPFQRDNRDNNERRRRSGQGRHNSKDSANKDNPWKERVIKIDRVTKVVKGGKNLSFRAVVVVGDEKGSFGLGIGRALEVTDAVRKAMEDAKKSVVRLPFDQGSVPHNTTCSFNSTTINLCRAPKGTGLIAPWMVKVALELAGLHNVVCKIHGSTNPANVLYCLVNAAKQLRNRRQIKQKQQFKKVA